MYTFYSRLLNQNSKIKFFEFKFEKAKLKGCLNLKFIKKKV